MAAGIPDLRACPTGVLVVAVVAVSDLG